MGGEVTIGPFPVRRSMSEQMREFSPLSRSVATIETSAAAPNPADAEVTCPHCRFPACKVIALHCTSCGMRL
jgi:hypothetical protein